VTPGVSSALWGASVATGGRGDGKQSSIIVFASVLACAMGRNDKVWYHLAEQVEGGGEQWKQWDDFYQQWQ
jgi:hypothetical protein